MGGGSKSIKKEVEEPSLPTVAESEGGERGNSAYYTSVNIPADAPGRPEISELSKPEFPFQPMAGTENMTSSNFMSKDSSQYDPYESAQERMANGTYASKASGASSASHASSSSSSGYNSGLSASGYSSGPSAKTMAAAAPVSSHSSSSGPSTSSSSSTVPEWAADYVSSSSGVTSASEMTKESVGSGLTGESMLTMGKKNNTGPRVKSQASDYSSGGSSATYASTSSVGKKKKRLSKSSKGSRGSKTSKGSRSSKRSSGSRRSNGSKRHNSRKHGGAGSKRGSKRGSAVTNKH